MASTSATSVAGRTAVGPSAPPLSGTCTSSCPGRTSGQSGGGGVGQPYRPGGPPAAPKPNPQPPSPEQAARILNEAWRDPDWGTLVWVAMTTGAKRAPDMTTPALSSVPGACGTGRHGPPLRLCWIRRSSTSARSRRGAGPCRSTHGASSWRSSASPPKNSVYQVRQARRLPLASCASGFPVRIRAEAGVALWCSLDRGGRARPAT